MNIQSFLQLIIPFLFSFTKIIEADENCCQSKVVNGQKYVLIGEDNTKASAYGCSTGCIYRHLEDNSARPSSFCFKQGGYESTCIEEPVNIGGCIGEDILKTYRFWIVVIPFIGPDDKFPKYWIPLLKNPCNFLRGPNCPCPCCMPFPTAQKIGIVGAGMAGLTMAWILQYIGHNAKIYQDRIFGILRIS